jgi:iron complex outermembrane recepter protein
MSLAYLPSFFPAPIHSGGGIFRFKGGTMMKTIAASLLLVCSLGRTYAQEEVADRDTVYVLSPVVVTATQAHERRTPATFSNLSPLEIRERYSMQDIPVLLSDLPSMTTYSENGNGIGYNYINLRGFDQRRISVMINGVPQNDPEDHNVYWIDFPDLMASADNIQVQRGAGSAFYGPPAIGGSINLVTNPFKMKPGITLETMFGFQEFGDSSKALPLNSRKYGISFNSGLVERQYMLYGRLGKIMSDGYRSNAFVNLNSYFFGAIRFDGTMTTRFHFFGGPLEDGLAYTGLPRFVKKDKKLRRQNLAWWELAPGGQSYASAAPRRPQETESFSQPHYELIHEWRLSPKLTLHNTLFHYAGDGYFDYDASWADTSALRLGSAYGIPATVNPANTLVRAFVGNRQWGWLPRAEIDHGNGMLTVGAEIRMHRSTHWGKIAFASDLPTSLGPDYHFYEYNGEKDILSAYVHELFKFRDDLTLMADLQLVRNRYGIRNEKFSGNRFDVTYFFANPRLGLNYNMSEEWNSYVSLAFTSREPRLRNLYAAEDAYFGATPQFHADTTGGRAVYDFSRPLAKPERLLNAELGARYRTPDALLAVNFFWMEFSDELVKSGQVDIFGQPVTGNAERTRHAGIEVEGAVNLATNLSLSGNVTLSRNRLVRYRIIGDQGEAVSLDGNPIAGFPDLLGNLRCTYRTDAFTGSLSVKYVGSFYTDNFKNALNRNDAFAVVNGEMLYRIPRVLGAGLVLRWEARNILNTLYFMNGEGDAFFPGAERNYVIGMTIEL